MADLLSLLGAIPSLISNFSGSTSSPYQKQQEQLASRQNQLSQALTDNNNPLYQQIYGQYNQQNRNNMAAAIAEAQGQNRMNANLGRTPLFSNERGSENIFRTMMQQYQNGGIQADQQARGAITQAMGGAGQALGAYNQITPYTIAANKQQNMGYQGIYDLLRGIGGGQQQPSQYNPGPITWNQQQVQQQPLYHGYSY